MGRNYLQLCNECINVMSYIPASTMEELNTPEGRMIKQTMNDILREICCGQKGVWKFRERDKYIYISEGVQDYDLPNGYIEFIRVQDNSNRIKLVYTDDKEKFLPNISGVPMYYYISTDKVKLYPKPNKSEDGKQYLIRYLTNDFAIDENNIGKGILENATDEPIIPDEYRSLLVYGTVRDMRAESTDPKQQYFDKKYKKLYSSMLSNQRLTEDYPSGNSLSTDKITSLQAKILAFKNPYNNGT